MSQVTVNGQTTPMPEPPKLGDLLRLLAPRKPFAVAHNEEFVPAVAYETQELIDGDRIEIVHPAAGG
jgi:sulfur carrier protein